MRAPSNEYFIKQAWNWSDTYDVLDTASGGSDNWVGGWGRNDVAKSSKVLNSFLNSLKYSHGRSSLGDLSSYSDARSLMDALHEAGALDDSWTNWDGGNLWNYGTKDRFITGLTQAIESYYGAKENTAETKSRSSAASRAGSVLGGSRTSGTVSPSTASFVMPVNGYYQNPEADLKKNIAYYQATRPGMSEEEARHWAMMKEPEYAARYRSTHGGSDMYGSPVRSAQQMHPQYAYPQQQYPPFGDPSGSDRTRTKTVPNWGYRAGDRIPPHFAGGPAQYPQGADPRAAAYYYGVDPAYRTVGDDGQLAGYYAGDRGAAGAGVAGGGKAAQPAGLVSGQPGAGGGATAFSEPSSLTSAGVSSGSSGQPQGLTFAQGDTSLGYNPAVSFPSGEGLGTFTKKSSAAFATVKAYAKRLWR